MPTIRKEGRDLIIEAVETQKAVELINLGARTQLLEACTTLSRERLSRIYREVKQKAPPRGMLPFSTEWFMPWQQNTHSTLFINIYRFMVENTKLDKIDAMIKAYRLYLEQVGEPGVPLRQKAEDALLVITRAWMLIRFVESNQLKTISCSKCSSHFLVNSLDLHKNPKCALCCPPPRAQRYSRAQMEAQAA